MLRGARLSDLPALLAALRPPAAQPLKRLLLSQLLVGEDAAAAAASLQACAPYWGRVRDLSVRQSPGLATALEPLLRQLPRLENLQLVRCGLGSLPAGPYLSGTEGQCGWARMAYERLHGRQLCAVLPAAEPLGIAARGRFAAGGSPRFGCMPCASPAPCSNQVEYGILMAQPPPGSRAGPWPSS